MVARGWFGHGALAGEGGLDGGGQVGVQAAGHSPELGSVEKERERGVR